MALISRPIAETRTAHDRLVAEVQNLLERRQWTVSREPHLAGNLRPDIVARDPDGNRYVIEVKAGTGQAHLGAVAQVESYRNSLETQLGQTKGVLVLAGGAPEQLTAVAERAGVELIDASSGDEGMSGSLASSLAALS